MSSNRDGAPAAHGRAGRWSRLATGGRTARPVLAARVAGAGLLAATGAVHLDLYLTGYRTIPTIGWLFLLQVAAAFLLAAAVLAVGYEAAEGARARAVAGAGAGFALLTLGGYLLSVWVGLFGFKEVRTTAGIVAGVVEVAALGLLGRLAVGAPVVRRTAGAVPWGGAVVALAVLIGSVASASGASSARPAGPVLLEARRVDGTTVLTNGRGFTLYWFARDSATASRCYGTCASYWPPVLGRPKAGPGVRGVLGTVSRTGGGVQATFDHHPLYAYVGDSSPGSANGNGLNLNGGLWHEVTLANSG